MQTLRLGDIPYIEHFRGREMHRSSDNAIQFDTDVCVFVSQPFNDISEEQVMRNLHAVGEALTSRYKSNMTSEHHLVIFDLYHALDHGSQTKNIAAALDVMDVCDFVIFVDGWDACGGCRIEYKYAKAIGQKCYGFDGTAMHGFKFYDI